MISAHSLPLGQTKEGRDWCLKALHPSDPMTDVLGIPDEDASPTAHLNFQSTFTLTPRAEATGTWGFNMALLPHPVNFLWYRVTDSAGTAEGNFMNGQLTGTTHVDKITAFWRNAHRYRLTYCSVTCYQDGPDLANQGTLVACQAPFEPALYSPCFVTINSGGAAIGTPMMHVEQFGVQDIPAFDVSQSMPNAYFNNSKFGAYVPLKLSRTHQQWTSVKDAVLSAQAYSNQDVPPGSYAMPTGASGGGVFPHTNIVPGFYNNSTAAIGGNPTSPMLSNGIASICARNLAVSTSFTFFVRMGIEIQVLPGSLYTTHLKVSPAPDPLALDNYFRIAREMKDAYPADYNDLGKIWDVISTIAKTVAPIISSMGPIGSAIGGAVGGAASLGDSIRSALSRRVDRAMETKPGGVVGSSADQAIAKAVVDKAVSASPSVQFSPRVVSTRKRKRKGVKGKK